MGWEYDFTINKELFSAKDGERFIVDELLVNFAPYGAEFEEGPVCPSVKRPEFPFKGRASR